MAHFVFTPLYVLNHMMCLHRRIIVLLLVSIFLLSAVSPGFAADMISDSLERITTSERQLEHNFNYDDAMITEYDISGVTFKLNNQESDGHISTSVKVIPGDEKQALELIAAAEKTVSSSTKSGGSSYKYDWDNNSLARAWTKVYYSKFTVDSKECIEIDKIEGGVNTPYSSSGTYIGDGTYIVSQELNVSQTGESTDNESIVQTRQLPFAACTRSYGYFPPGTWDYVVNNSLAYVGCSYQVILEKNSVQEILFVYNMVD